MEETQEGLFSLAGEKLGEFVHLFGGLLRVSLHQKYPSRFFFSIEPASSRSMSLPLAFGRCARSASLWTMASSVSASDSMAPVSG